jgi:predicted nuclease of predicted toxin-antitoxin system
MQGFPPPMRILLDESIPRKFGFLLGDHFVRTVQQMGFGGLVNGKLLKAASSDFDVLISGDQNMSYQQNANTLPMSVIVLIAKNNKLGSFEPLVPKLFKALDALDMPKFIQIEAEI